MKNKNLLILFALTLMTFMLSSCGGASGMFTSDVGFNLFLIIAVIISIAVVVLRSGRSKTAKHENPGNGAPVEKVLKS